MRRMENPFTGAPFTVRPRLDTKPWGGTRLASMGFERPSDAPEPLGEVLVSADQSVISSGAYEGLTLGDLTRRFPGEVAGRLGLGMTRGRPVFPLLIKLIDAASNLSIQVHPDDDQAAALGSTGKTEAWYILEAPADAQLFLGLTSVAPGPFLAACEAGDGSSSRFLRQIAARTGETVLLPAGTVHALGAGVLIYEVQQPSELTYRLDDWGRVSADGRPRERHLVEGARAIKPYLRPSPTTGADRDSAIGQRQFLVACRYFALERISLSGDDRLVTTTSGSPQIVTVVAGEVVVGDDDRLSATVGGSIVVPAAQPSVNLTCTGEATVLRAWIPDLPAEVIGPARRAGISDTILAALGVSTP